MNRRIRKRLAHWLRRLALKLLSGWLNRIGYEIVRVNELERRRALKEQANAESDKLRVKLLQLQNAVNQFQEDMRRKQRRSGGKG